MKVMILNKTTHFKENKMSLELVDIPVTEPKTNKISVKILIYGACYTELDETNQKQKIQIEYPIFFGKL
jgi:Zn-dependent alcohol dehydrogenase